ncbi:MAG: restriction endonuclease subunit S [Burkholderiales bacterium]
MAVEWKSYRLEELCEFINGFAFKSTDYVVPSPDTIEVFRMGYIERGGGFKEDNTPVFVPRKYVRNLEKYFLKPCDVTIAMTDMKDRVAILGNTAWVRDAERFVLNQRVGCIRVKRSDLLDPRFLYFYSNWQPHVDYLRSRANSGVQVNLTTSSIKESELVVPPLPEQKAIASILGALDDKIELNRRMNATLEAMARALFQSWFVDFDPVRAKLDGRKPAGLDPETAALFPATFQDSPLGHIPQGWKAGTLSEGFNLTMGQSPPGDTYNEDGNGIPLYQGRTDFGFRFPTRRIYCTAPTRYAKPGDTLVSVRAPVGDINMADEECCIGRGVAAVRHKSGAVSFTYYAMENLSTDFALFEGEGTVFGSINKQSFENLRFVMPSPDIVAAYEQLAKPLDDQISTLVHQSRTLAAIRDALLPRLISGEMRVGADKVTQG